MSFNIMNNIDYKVGIYIRLSKEDEEKEKYSESESIQNQRTLLMQYIKENKLNFISIEKKWINCEKTTLFGAAKAVVYCV